MAEAILAAAFAERGVEATVHSAGLLDDGLPAADHAITAVKDRGLDLSRHASRRMTAELVAGADLIIGMERRHVREAAVMVPGAWNRSFTLPELARRAQEAGPRPADQSVEAWLAELVAGRRPDEHLGSSSADEVADPVGRGLRIFRRSADEIADLTRIVVDHLFPAGPTGFPTPAARSTRA
jgi:protein-tyrosine-phosphatase